MSTDRRIDLQVSVPDFGAALQSGAGGSQARKDADAGAQERFRQAMQEAAAKEAAPPAALPQAPFSLFGGAAPPAQRAPADPAITGDVAAAVASLAVGDGRSGNQQVRIELKDDVLPGVTVTIQQAEGRLLVDFTCSVESSRLRLNDAAPAQAQELATRLARDVLVRVQTDDDDDPCLLEAAASP